MILVLSGTSDGRELAIKIKSEGFPLLATVVTDNAAISLKEKNIPVRVGRLTTEEMVELINEKEVNTIVDASHPYAEEASRNAIKAAEMAKIPYIRFEREITNVNDHPLITVVKNYEQAAELAATKQGVVMLTTGSKTLATFAKKLIGKPNLTMVARMLPRKDNMEKCEQLGVEQKNIIAIQGPFSKELNIALYKQFGTTLMVTKESGKVGSVDEKVEAALELDIPIIMIERPKINYGKEYSKQEEVISELKILNR
ncbi:precorrin-6A reductase [Anaerobacillus sp. MEB173]|uniref:precorrin-6A reductase n=1 Tax=Anaerobacillus sp. MEB173 TaxID=3383345 RepID=UPI003F91106F